jgi:hypothetical protein
MFISLFCRYTTTMINEFTMVQQLHEEGDLGEEELKLIAASCGMFAHAFYGAEEARRLRAER